MTGWTRADAPSRGERWTAPACCLLLALTASAPAAAQCRTACVAGEARDPYGCCISVRRAARRVVRRPAEERPEAIAGDDDAPLAPDLATEAYAAARAWLARARSFEPSLPARAAALHRRAAGAALVFLAAAPDDARAGRMRAVLVAALDGASMTDAADREAASLGGPRPAPEPDELRTLLADTLANFAWAHLAIARRIDSSASAPRRARAVARYRRAADHHRLFLASFPSSAAAPSARSELANALLAAGDHLEAAAELEELARTVPARRAEALRRAIDAYERALAADLQAGRAELRTDAPEPSRRPPWAAAQPFPEPLQRLFDARERYLGATRDDPEPDLFREQHLENALWLYRYGHFDDARARLAELLTARCDDRTARNAFAVLGLMEQPPREARAARDEEVCALRRAACAGDPACLANAR